jgi:hypothetical protein
MRKKKRIGKRKKRACWRIKGQGLLRRRGTTSVINRKYCCATSTDQINKTINASSDALVLVCSTYISGFAWRVVLQDPVYFRQVQASGSHIYVVMVMVMMLWKGRGEKDSESDGGERRREEEDGDDGGGGGGGDRDGKR